MGGGRETGGGRQADGAGLECESPIRGEFAMLEGGRSRSLRDQNGKFPMRVRVGKAMMTGTSTLGGAERLWTA